MFRNSSPTEKGGAIWEEKMKMSLEYCFAKGYEMSQHVGLVFVSRPLPTTTERGETYCFCLGSFCCWRSNAILSHNLNTIPCFSWKLGICVAHQLVPFAF